MSDMNGEAAQSPILDDLEDDHRKRGTYRMLERALRAGLDMPETVMTAAVNTAIKDMAEKDGRIRARAREFLLAVQTKSVEAAIALDKIDRLDGDKPTDRLHISAEDEELAKRIAERRLGLCEDG